ncbi:unnamed protein product, partial [Auanema sp. JU1783]
EIEALGLIFALTQFRTYVLGTHTTCITDHRPLTSLLTRRDLFGRLAKFQLVIQEYDIEIRYREGRLNDVCDALSRYIGQEANDPKPERKKKVLENINFITLNSIKEIQHQTPWIKRSIADIEYRSAKKLIGNDRYCVIENLLYTKPGLKKPTPALVIPRDNELTRIIIDKFHKDPTIGAHQGIARTKDAILRRFYWTNMQEDIANYIKTCLACQTRKKDPRHMTVEPLGKFIIPTKPFARIHMDVMGPFPTSRLNNTQVLTIQDSFTKFAV